MTVVIDSSVLIASVLPQEPLEEDARRALRNWISNRVPLAAPHLLRDEVVAVVRKAVFQKRIDHEYGKTLVTDLLHSTIAFHDDDELLTEAYEIAARFNLPRTYDAEYLALAERLDCEFWTADEVLVNTIQAKFNHIRWLGNFTSP